MSKWDSEPWGLEHFKQVIQGVSSISTNLNMCFISFCAAEQFHHIVEAAAFCQWSKPRFNVIHKVNKQAEGSRRLTQTCEFFAQFWRSSEHNGIWNFQGRPEERTDFYKTAQIGRGGYQSTDPDSDVVNPCQKPQQVLQRIVRNFTTPGALILDLCAGSHSLMFSCLDLGRSCVSVELDEPQHVAAIQRLRTVLQKKTFEEQKSMLEEKMKSQISNFPPEQSVETQAPIVVEDEQPKGDQQTQGSVDPFEFDGATLPLEGSSYPSQGATIEALELLAQGGHSSEQSVPEAQEESSEEIH